MSGSSQVGRILYLSLVDISVPYGPGVNERVFLHDLLKRFGEDLLAVIPAPSRGLPGELEDLRTQTFPTITSVRSPIGWVCGRVMGSVEALRAIRSFRPVLTVMRFGGAVPLPHYLAVTLEGNLRYVIKTAGDVSCEAFYRNRRLGRLLKPANEAMMTRLLNGAECVDVVSSAQRDTAVRLYPELDSVVHVIDNGVDIDQFRPTAGDEIRTDLGFDPDDIVLGFVGNYPMGRGGKEVVEVVARLESSWPVKGMVVGDSGEAEACRRLAREKGVLDSVVICGEVPFEQVPELMSAMDIGLSVLRPEERDESEQKVRQYLAMGLCVVGTGGSNDFLRGRPFARVTETDDLEDVTKAVSQFVQRGREGIGRLGEGARAFAEESLSYEAINDRRLALWQGILGKAPETGRLSPA